MPITFQCLPVADWMVRSIMGPLPRHHAPPKAAASEGCLVAPKPSSAWTPPRQLRHETARTSGQPKKLATGATSAISRPTAHSPNRSCSREQRPAGRERGQRRIAPLRWGAGAAPPGEAPREASDSIERAAHRRREEGFTLTLKKRPGPALRERRRPLDIAAGDQERPASQRSYGRSDLRHDAWSQQDPSRGGELKAHGFPPAPSSPSPLDGARR